MIIYDLNHLGVVSEASSITGGKLDIALDIDQKQNQKLDIQGSNINVINQTGVAVAAAVAFKGKAVAKAEVNNSVN